MYNQQGDGLGRRPEHGHGVAREGAVTGLLGAAAVALWFLLVDAVAGHPLFTPHALGTVLFAGFGAQTVPGAPVDLAVVAGYTVFHCASFVGVGCLAVYCTHLSERQPVILALFFILFAMFEMAFYGLTAVLDDSGVLGGIAWWQVAAGNLLATACMGTYLWRRHPGMHERIQFALSR